PGFAYLTGLGEELAVPRRASPRTAVPPGSVGVADIFTGVYPRSSPGGWQIIGATDVCLWDPGKEPPALLAPGTRVRFVDVT
ncbi:MAG TPA: carboxyltransferase domain-containing protein, partial [Streptosporangiaceae bacterium]|nr:carboxyltransferase domain-containing protein [Streptosporangiaceae bacterium]